MEIWYSQPGKYDSLPGKYESLPGKYESLPGKYDSLSGKYESLPGKYESLSGKYESLSGKYESLPGKELPITANYTVAKLLLVHDALYSHHIKTQIKLVKETLNTAEKEEILNAVDIS